MLTSEDIACYVAGKYWQFTGLFVNPGSYGGVAWCGKTTAQSSLHGISTSLW